MKRRFMRLTAWTLTFVMAFAFLLPVWADEEGDGSLSPEDPQLVSRQVVKQKNEKYDVILNFMVPDEAMLDLPESKTIYVMLGSCDFIETKDTSPSIQPEGNLLKVTIPALKHTGTGNSLSATIVFEYNKSGVHQKSFQVSTNLPGVGNVQPEQPMDGTSKFIGYKITSKYGWITKNSTVSMDLYIMDVDLLKNPGHTLKGLYLSLSDCSFTYNNLPITSLPKLQPKGNGIFSVSLNNIRYSGTGKSLSVELGYQIGGTEKTCPITATINECIEWTEPEPPEPPSSSDPIVLDSLKPNILLESFSIRSSG